MAETQHRLTLQFALALALAAGLATSVLGQPIGSTAPKWKDLTPAEKQVLTPLSPDWDQWDAQRRLKWRGIAQRYPKMAPDQQQRVQQQMRAWAELTPDQRRIAREQYKSLKSLPPEKKQEVTQKWQEYQSLPPETKRELAAKPPPSSTARVNGSNAGSPGPNAPSTASRPSPAPVPAAQPTAPPVASFPAPPPATSKTSQ